MSEMNFPMHFSFGNVQVILFNAGFLRADLANWYGLKPGDWSAAYHALFEAPVEVPTQCVYVQRGSMALLVDAAAYDITPDSPFAIPGYQPPPPLPQQMMAAGIDPATITHVVITHAHFDHFNGATIRQGQQVVPAFANARYYLSREEWEREDLQAALREPGRLEQRTLGVLAQMGKLSLVDGDVPLGPGITILAAPGETPGHQIVRVQTDEGTLYCVGDLYHHPVEIEQPEWQVYWADAEKMQASRSALLHQMDDRTWVVATHIAGVGQIRPAGSSLHWQRVQ